MERERVTALRSHHQIPCYSPERKQSEGWMNLTEAAGFLKLSPRTVRLAVEVGELRADHPLSDGPWIFNRGELTTDAAERLTERAHRGSRRPAIPAENQSGFEFSST